MTEKLNFNALAWEAPKHGDNHGYIPTDKYYNEICEWLKSCPDKYRTKRVNDITTVRKSIPNSEYDVIVTYHHSNKMIQYYFKKYNEFEI